MPDKSIISTRGKSLKPSLTLAITARANELKQQGQDICSLSAGEPDFDTPTFIVEASVKALRDGVTRYGPAAGDPLLRKAIAQKESVGNEVKTKAEQVLVTNGGKQAIFNLFQIILQEGDEVIIPSPYWLSYPEMARLAGARPVFIQSNPQTGFKTNLDELIQKINKRTKLLILNSPGNPTGRVMDKQEMESIAEVLRENPQILIMSDEIYEHLLDPNQVHRSFTSIAPDLRDRIFTVNGFAKGWAMTGWRVGYLIGNELVIKAAAALQSQSTSNVCSFAQKGALAALNGSYECVNQMASKYTERRRLLTEGLLNIKDITLIPPKGAFYAFPKLPDYCPSSIDFCNMALEEYGLAVIPGKAFGDDRCIRISCAANTITIKDGLSRLNNILLGYDL